MGIVEWMTAILLVRPIAIEIGEWVVVGRSAWSTVRPGRVDRAAGSDRPLVPPAESMGLERGAVDAPDTGAVR